MPRSPGVRWRQDSEPDRLRTFGARSNLQDARADALAVTCPRHHCNELQEGELVEEEGVANNARFAKLKIEFLRDAVMCRRALAIAARMARGSKEIAEIMALAQLQADALVTADERNSESAVARIHRVNRQADFRSSILNGSFVRIIPVRAPVASV